MARIAGTKNKMRTPEEKEKIVLENLEGHKSRLKICREYQISSATIHQWICKYRQKGIAGLKSQTGTKKGPGKGRKRKVQNKK